MSVELELLSTLRSSYAGVVEKISPSDGHEFDVMRLTPPYFFKEEDKESHENRQKTKKRRKYALKGSLVL